MLAKFAGPWGKLLLLGLLLQAVAGQARDESDEGITWLAAYQGGSLPAAPQWTWHGDKDVRPGRLLYVYGALTALYIDVELLK
jgi:hypothetical protein